MRTWLAAMILLSAALAGCTEEPRLGPEDGTDGGDGGDPGDGGSEPPIALNNTAPAAVLTADILNGTAPLQVNVTLEGSDADGDNLTWTLAHNGNVTGNGTTLPATLEVTLEAGNHTFALTVSDGNLSAAANLTIVVVAAQEVPQGPCGGAPEPCKVSEDAWVEFWSDGTCEAKDERGSDQAGWWHDRPGTMPVVGGSAPYGSGYLTGGGTWVYEETNGKAGMQVHKDEGGAYGGCIGGDTIIF